MTHLCKRWVYFPNLHLSKSLSLSFSSPPSATVYFYPQTFSRPLGLCVRRVLLLTNRSCSGAGMHFRSCFCSCAVNCRTAFHLSRKAPPLAVIDRSCSHSDHELLGLSKLRRQSLKQQSQLQQSRTVKDELMENANGIRCWLNSVRRCNYIFSKVGRDCFRLMCISKENLNIN